MIRNNSFRCVAIGSNSIDPFIPELWAQESVLILQEYMIAANLVHRDFQPLVANFGDVVNTRKPSEFVAYRKTNDDNVTIQDASATNIAVPLDQHAHVSFLIKDGEQSKSFKDLVQEYMVPAMLAEARIIDQTVLGQWPQFYANRAGYLGLLSSTNGPNYILDTRHKMNVNKAYVNNRNLIVTSQTETQLLKNELFISAEKVGDQGTALREASLGRKLGFDIYMCQNQSYVNSGNTVKTGAVNNASGYAAGTTTITVDGFTGAVTTGGFLSLGGRVYRISNHTETLGNTTSIVLTAGLDEAVADNDVIVAYTPGAVNNSGGYAAGYSKAITVDGFTVAPQVGQMVAFGTASALYTVIGQPTTTSIMLDRPLDASIADDAIVAISPAGSYNFAFHRNALALVVRPLALPAPGTGARSGVVNDGGISIRATITYNGEKQGHLVTLDMLYGVKVLDVNLGAVMLG